MQTRKDYDDLAFSLKYKFLGTAALDADGQRVTAESKVVVGGGDLFTGNGEIPETSVHEAWWLDECQTLTSTTWTRLHRLRSTTRPSLQAITRLLSSELSPDTPCLHEEVCKRYPHGSSAQYLQVLT